MTGHLQIVEARRRGLKPAAIFIEIGEPLRGLDIVCSCPVRQALRDALYNPECAMESGQYPVVYVDADEKPDLRFVKRCHVFVSGPAWSQRLIDLGMATATAGASCVVVSASRESSDLMIFANGEWISA